MLFQLLGFVTGPIKIPRAAFVALIFDFHVSLAFPKSLGSVDLKKSLVNSEMLSNTLKVIVL